MVTLLTSSSDQMQKFLIALLFRLACFLAWLDWAFPIPSQSSFSSIHIPFIFWTMFLLLLMGLFFHMSVEHSLHYEQITLLALLTRLLYQLLDWVFSAGRTMSLVCSISLCEICYHFPAYIQWILLFHKAFFSGTNFKSPFRI